MTQSVQVSPVSESYTRAVTNFWKNEKKSTLMKIIKLIGSIIGYIFALPLDAATKIGQLFGKDEKPAAKTLSQKIQNFGTKGKEAVVKFMSNRWGKTLMASAALVGVGYYFNVHNIATGFFSKSL